MTILSAEKISKSYSEKILLNEISLSINEGEKIGVIGINGTGKSTLLKIVAGVEYPDNGRIIKSSSANIGYLPQNPEFEDGITVLQQVFKGDSAVMRLLRDYEQTLQLLNEDAEDDSGDDSLDAVLTKRLLALTQKMDTMQAWTIESEAKNILTRLGNTDFDKTVSTLSGGQKKRVAMAAALINPANLLILDEPTNHIDNTTVDWLEKYLNARKGALLMVTHDRYFLDRVANRIIELDNGRLFSYQANYSKYLEMKAEREELEQSSERKRQSLFRTELEWIRQGAQARSTKQKARIERFEKLKGQQGSAAYENIEIKVGSSRLGKKIIELEHVCKSFSNTEIIKDFNYILQRDDRIGIIGLNGTGKSTLLKIISGRLKPDNGSVAIGDTVKIGFFTQESEEMNVDLRVIEYIREEAEYLTTSEGSISASMLLERFLFPPEAHWTPVAKLSGGEKRRLYLLRILMGAPNILMLDEPTNDLDIQTLTILENYLDDFPGAVITVSHDRYFLDRVVDRIFAFDGNCNIKKYEGNYSYYYENIQKEAAQESEIGTNYPKTGAGTNNLRSNAGSSNARTGDRPVKFTFKEQKEFDQIDAVVAELESELNGVNQKIIEASSDFALLQELLLKKEQLEGQLSEAMERWVYLNEIAET